MRSSNWRYSSFLCSLFHPIFHCHCTFRSSFPQSPCVSPSYSHLTAVALAPFQNTYDSSSSYDSYGRFSNMHDDLKARSMPPRDLSEPPVSPGGHGGRGRDPYRYSRVTAQPLSPGGDTRGHRWV